MNFKRIGMALVSIVLVCCLLVNVSPIKAEAFAIESAVAIGCAAVLSLAACGVIFHPQTQKDIEIIGNAFSRSLYQWGTSAEKLTEVDEFLGGLTLYDGSGDDDDNSYDQIWKYAKGGIWGGIAAFIVGAILDNCIKADGNSSEDGWAYYNGVLLPDFSLNVDSSYPEYNYRFIYRNNNTNRYFLSVSPFEASVQYNSGFGCNAIYPGRSVQFYYASGASQWNGGDSIPDGTSYVLNGVLDLIWSSHDLYDTNGFLFFSGSAPSSTQTVVFEPDIFVGDIPEKVKTNEYDIETLPLPETIYYGNVIDPDLGAVQSVINLADDLATGKITFDEYITYITPPEIEPDPDVTQPEETLPDIEIPEPTIDSDTLSNADPNTFLEQLGAYITAPFRWIWTKIETYFEPLTRPELWTKTIPEIVMTPARWIWEKIETVIAPMLDPDVLTRPLPEIISAPFQNLWNNMQNAFDSLKQTVGDAPQKVVDGIKEAVVPDKDYLSDKINALRDRYGLADSLMSTGKDLKDFLLTIGQQPPIIYIDLGATRGSYDIGGKTVLVDLTWYGEYKPTMDLIISAFLWLWTIWRLLIVAPGIISGAAGTPGTHDKIPDDIQMWSGFTRQTKSQYDRNHMRFNLNSMKWGRRR